ncbi:uncharacterized protein LOC122884119 [Siniperca chuatsi]|uniref:uncharacterized protein LOC122884119 n=1 Tax=Siniperca chuatsi TaxID=119488 RepID=UPI001CE02CC9|nr:uncharacterized protein LOC122884119 [Siniperca chuatsi]
MFRQWSSREKASGRPERRTVVTRGEGQWSPREKDCGHPGRRPVVASREGLWSSREKAGGRPERRTVVIQAERRRSPGEKDCGRPERRTAVNRGEERRSSGEKDCGRPERKTAVAAIKMEAHYDANISHTKILSTPPTSCPDGGTIRAVTSPPNTGSVHPDMKTSSYKTQAVVHQHVQKHKDTESWCVFNNKTVKLNNSHKDNMKLKSSIFTV